MAYITTIRYDGTLNGEPWLIYKYPDEQFLSGTRLVVKQGQEAIIFKSRKNSEVYQSGTHVLYTNHTLDGIDETFSAEIYYVNITSKLDMNWGTQTPFQLEDPKYGLILSIRSYGKYGLRIQNSKMFVSELTGTVYQGATIDYMMIASYFSAFLTTRIKTVISKFMIQKQISFLEVTAFLDELSDQCQAVISDEFERFGVEIQNFNIVSITPLKEEYEQLQRNKQEMALGSSFYIKNRSYQILEKIAEQSEHASFEDAGKGLRILQSGNAESNDSANVNLKDGSQKNRSCANGNFCPDCGSQNMQGMKYCGNCGHLLTKTCSRCNTVCGSGQKFCSNCGGQL